MLKRTTLQKSGLQKSTLQKAMLQKAVLKSSTLGSTPRCPSALSCYLTDISTHKLLTKLEEGQLSRAARAGDRRARDRMILCNLRLVIRTARQYQRADMALEDLISEGNIGLMHALRKFEPERGYRFSTYAMWWIRQYIERGIMNQARTVRLPVHKAKRLNTCLRAARQIEQSRCRAARSEEIAEYIARPVNEVRELMGWRERPQSLSLHRVTEDGGQSLIATESDCPVRQSSDQQICRALERLLLRLSERERKVLRLRFGLSNQNEHTLDDIAVQIGLTRERIRQIQVIALQKLKAWVSAESIEGNFLDGS